MVQLKILSGNKAGTEYVARHFPVRIGRAASCDLTLEDPGVWEQHARIALDPAEGFLAVSEPDAIMRAGGHPVQRAVLRNGDMLELGMARVQFWLSPVVQRRFSARETLTWCALGLLCIGQILLVYLLTR